MSDAITLLNRVGALRDRISLVEAKIRASVIINTDHQTTIQGCHRLCDESLSAIRFAEKVSPATIRQVEALESTVDWWLKTIEQNG